MDILNSVLNSLFGLIFSPFKSLDPAWGLVVVSFLTGIVMLFVFKATSDQPGIKRAKNLVKGHFLAIRLYKDDISLMFDTMKNIIMSNLFYMRKSLRPMLFLIVPVVLILIQLGSRYEYRPLKVGESTLLTVRLHRAATMDELRQVKLDLPDGLAVESYPVRIEQQQEVNWRIKALKPGRYDVTIKFDDRVVGKQLQVEGRLNSLSPQVASNDFMTALLYPAESSIPGKSFAASIAVFYPKRDFDILGFKVHWLVAFFILSIVFGFAFKGFLGVEV